MQRCKRFISVLLILVSCATFIPTAALADDIPEPETAVTEPMVVDAEAAAPVTEPEIPAETEEPASDGEEETLPESEKQTAGESADGQETADSTEEQPEEQTEETAEEEDDLSPSTAEESEQTLPLEESGTDILSEKIDISLENVSIPADEYADNDELFAQYVERTMGAGTAPATYSMRRARKSAGSNLSGLNATIYTLLRAEIEQIAAGTLTNTTITFKANELGIADEKFTAEDLGLTDVVKSRIVMKEVEENGEKKLVSVEENYITAEAKEAIFQEYAERYNSLTILYALLADCPYDLYWFNKTTASQFGFYSIGARKENGVWRVYMTEFLCRMSVSQAYAARNPETNAILANQTNGGVGTSVQKAKETAAAIVSRHASESDYNKLCSYFKEICDLTKYNDAAAAGSNQYPGGYGDPWQLIWVFDGDDTTDVVCEGYSKAFQYLCDLSDFRGEVECFSPTGGLSANGGTPGAHMWNVVTISGVSYLVDITNCDDNHVGKPDKLFLAGTSGSVSEGYTFEVGGMTVKYTYDTGSCSVFDQNDLALADTAYAATIENGLIYKCANKKAAVIGYTDDLPAQVEIPSNVQGCVVKEISAYAFSGADEMTCVTVPAWVEGIGKAAFSNCTALSNVIFLGSAPTIASSAFSSVKASVSYTADAAWTDAAGDSYGGSLSWMGALKGKNGSISASYTGDNAFSGDDSITLTKITVPQAVETAIQKLASAADKLVKYVAYDISLGDGNLAGTATVTVQAPTGFGEGCKLYRVEDNGSLTDMKAEYEDGALTFTTSHFSTYIVTRERMATLAKGDVNGDGNAAGMTDAMMMAQSLIGLVELDADEAAAADLDGNGTVDGMDAVLAAQIAIGAITMADLKK